MTAINPTFADCAKSYFTYADPSLLITKDDNSVSKRLLLISWHYMNLKIIKIASNCQYVSLPNVRHACVLCDWILSLCFTL